MEIDIRLKIYEIKSIEVTGGEFDDNGIEVNTEIDEQPSLSEEELKELMSAIESKLRGATFFTGEVGPFPYTNRDFGVRVAFIRPHV
jgi:hypothetical protein